MSFALRMILMLSLLIAPTSEALAQIVHTARQGDTIPSIAQEYYGDASKAIILRAVNNIPEEGEVALAVGEPVQIPESWSRLVRDGETWQNIAQSELGVPDRAWYIALVNGSSENTPPSAGQLVSVPYLMPWALSEGLAATLSFFYPEKTARERIETARHLIRLNIGLRPRGTVRGTRIVLPFVNLNILPEKRSEILRERGPRRSVSDQQRQQEATQQLEELPLLLSQGHYAEMIQLAGRIAGASELTEAQLVTMHRYLGQAFLALDRLDLAEQEFRAILELQPDFQFDQVTTSPTVLELLERVRETESQE